MTQRQIYIKLVCTFEADATDAQIDNFLASVFNMAGSQSRVTNYIDTYKTWMRWVVSRPAAVAANARILGWHAHLPHGEVLEEAEA